MSSRILKFNTSLWLKEVLLFGGAQALGLVVAEKYLLDGLTQNTPLPLTFGFTVTDLVAGGLVLGLLIWSLIKKNGVGRWFFRLFLILAIWGGVEIVLAAFLSPLVALAGSLVLLMILLRQKSVLAHNLLILMALAGIGGLIGLSFNPLTAVGILLVFSFYDLAAVYLTKHMVKMAQGMLKAGAIFGFIVPFHWEGFGKKTIQAKPGEGFMILGSGDVVLPLLLSSSLVRFSLLQAWTVAAFSLSGLWLTHILFFGQTKRQPMAALPPIVLMSIVGYLVALVVF